MSESDQKPKHNRRWLSFRLRTLLIVVTLFCVWLAWIILRVERQREAVRWIEENHGEVCYEYQFDSEGKFIEDAQLPVPEWLHGIFGIDYFSNVSCVYLDGNQVSDLTPLGSLTNLKTLDLVGTQVTDLTPLSELRSLQSLSLVFTQIQDLKPLHRLSNLESFGLFFTEIPYEEIEELQDALPNCRVSSDVDVRQRANRSAFGSKKKPSDKLENIFDN